MRAVCDKEKCTLCMACINSCPKNAIYVEHDEYGYEYLFIDEEKCVHCDQCTKTCESRNFVQCTESFAGYVFQIKDKMAIKKSASGGAIQAIAKYILEKNGVCYGCKLVRDNEGFHAEHIRVDKIENLPSILNSKYLPSYIKDAYKNVERDLKKGMDVLFTGTPCQIQGLKSYLKREYDKLLTVDIICHGVPNTVLFNDYIHSLEKIDNIRILDYVFRDKSISWGTNSGYYYYNKKKSKLKYKHQPRELSSFMARYLCGDIFRENCYQCTLASINRVSDLTCGDFWSIETEYPDWVTGKEDGIRIRRGVSCILVNSIKGENVLNELKDRIVIKKVEMDSIIRNNGNLREPSLRSKYRDSFLKNIKENGYILYEKEYRKRIRKKKILFIIKNYLKGIMPDKVRVLIYKTYIRHFGKLDY